MKKLLTFLTLLPLFGTFPALQAAAAESCIGSACEVRFDYTGAQQQHIIPAAAKNIQIELHGAQGGKGGGAGGQTSATLPDDLEGRIFVLVGGAGSSQALAPGGFNGGGQAGSAHGDEGSGGGATDIRSTLALVDRLVVAGGGGGTGGWSGAQGAPGGGLVARDGDSGQGGGGKGGSQSEGGLAGSSNGGFRGTGGSFGHGGVGGISVAAGGGGGGSGWYGGGGGGADIDNCCSDGGGGGGGSSYAYSSASNVVHQIGTNFGNGYAILRYEIELSVVSTDLVQLSPNSFELSIEFNQSVALEAANFDAPAECDLNLVTDTQLFWRAIISDCDIAVGTLNFHGSNSPVGAQLPSLPMLFEITMDRSGPVLMQEFEFRRVGNANPSVAIEVHDAATELLASDFQVDGCETWNLQGSSSNLNLHLVDCADGEIRVTLPALILQDALGNLGPLQQMQWLIELDTQGPELTLTTSEVISADAGYEFSITMLSSEQLENQIAPIIDLGETDCRANQAGNNLNFTECKPGSVLVLVAANSLRDDLMNSGPKLNQAITVEILAPPPQAPEPVVIAPVIPEIALPTVPTSQPAIVETPVFEVVDPAPVVQLPDPIGEFVPIEDSLDPEQSAVNGGLVSNEPKEPIRESGPASQVRVSTDSLLELEPAEKTLGFSAPLSQPQQRPEDGNVQTVFLPEKPEENRGQGTWAIPLWILFGLFAVALASGGMLFRRVSEK